MTAMYRLFIHHDGATHSDTLEPWERGFPDVDGYDPVYANCQTDHTCFAVYRESPAPVPTAREVAEAMIREVCWTDADFEKNTARGGTGFDVAQRWHKAGRP